ncbi:hypothetical protein COV93_01710 [Candidatus Woesearchaeota archaeon CG11_big_fil_rev_8_21_14_0_20_43_8]|nr:MAG: hypothetical protein COV93_01710 [Candidatus Woesearchaeota archaeon CG11_big_fil_rev_8_21_14_0_20_43_8]
MKETIHNLKPESIRHADEITEERIRDESLRYDWFWTADCALYRMESDEAVLYLTRSSVSPIMADVGEASKQFDTLHDYYPKKDLVQRAVAKESTLKVRLSDLDLICKRRGEYPFFSIFTEDLGSLSGMQRMVAERIYGSDLDKSMAMLRREDVYETRISFMHPDIVESSLVMYEDHVAIARPCTLFPMRLMGLRSQFIAGWPSEAVKMNGNMLGELK